MSRIIASMLFVVICAISAYAEDWYQGSITLKNGKTLRGEIAIQYAYDVALFRIGSDVTVFPAFKVESFAFYDGSVDVQKEFISVQFTDGVTTTHRFFETVVAGEYSVLRRQDTAWYSMHLDILEYDYFVFSSSGDFVPMEKFRRKVYPHLLEESNGNLKTYVHANRLSPSRLLDSILIVRHFNSLRDNATLAKN
jgi:hypothetical protein